MFRPNRQFGQLAQPRVFRLINGTAHCKLEVALHSNLYVKVLVFIKLVYSITTSIFSFIITSTSNIYILLIYSTFLEYIRHSIVI